MEQLARRLQARWWTVVPWWLAPGALSLALAVAALAQVLERGCCNAPPVVGGPMLALISVCWVLVTCGPTRPRLVFLLLVLPPAALRIARSYDDLTPLYLLLVPAWAGYTARPRLADLLARVEGFRHAGLAVDPRVQGEAGCGTGSRPRP